MTKEETTKLVFMIKSTYPKTYEKFSSKEFENMIDMWAFVLSEYDYCLISIGLKAFLTSDTSGFPPTPGQLIAYTKTNDPKRELTSNEAWSLVYKAICNSNYNSEAEFEKLPELCKKAIGNAASLRELASMDTNTVQSVEGSHFKRNYEALAKREKEYMKIPEATRRQLEDLQSSILLEEKT